MKRILISLLGVLMVLAMALPTSALLVLATESVPNPPLEESCGLDIVLVMDESTSIDATEFGLMKAAFVGFVNALSSTPTEFALVDFGTVAYLRQGFTSDYTVIKAAINATKLGGTQYTNWQQGLLLARGLFPNRDNPDLIIFASDGNPTAYGNPPTTGTDPATMAAALAAAIPEANAAKSAGIRILTIGIGDSSSGDPTQQLNIANLIDISSADAVITTDFAGLADALAELATALCGGTITVHKIIDCDGDLATTKDQSDGEDWTFTADVDSPGSSSPSSGDTDSDGRIIFDIDFGGECTATVSIVETLDSNSVLLDAICTGAKTNGTFDGTDSIDDIILDWNDIVICTFYNQPPQPTCTITAPDSVYQYSTGNTASVPSAGAGASYDWTITGGTITGGQGTNSITWTAGAAGTATIGVTVTNAYGCECSDDVEVTVTAMALEITAASDSKVYDGTALTNSGYNITAGSLAVDHTLVSVNVTGSQTDVGSSANVPSAAVILDGDLNDVTANYNITYVNGTLTVTARPLEITAASDSKVYDGTPLTNSGYNITAGSLAAGDSLISVNVTGSQTEVGSSANVPSGAVILDGDLNDVTANYNITYVNGTLTVTAGPTPSPASGGGGGGCPLNKYLTVDWEGNNTTEPLYDNDRLAVDLLGPSLDLSHSLLLEQGTHAPIVGTRTYYLIVVRELEEIPPLPENTVAIIAVNITPAGAEFNRDIFLTLGLDQLPENALNVTMAYYDDVNGVWVPLDYEAGGPSGVAELTLSAPINHFSIFGILAELSPTPQPPAHFEASGLSIVPSMEKTTFVTKTGESVTIAATITNDGGQVGTYTVVLKLNGETVDTTTVMLGAGQSQQVSFTRSGLDDGQYDVEVAGLSGEFTTSTSRTITWWLIIVLIAAIGLIIWGVVWSRRRRKAHKAA